MTDFKDLTKQRGQIRTRLTVFEKYLNPFLSATAEPITKSQCNELVLRIAKIKELSSTFDEIQTKIEFSDVDEAQQMQEREETENRFYNLLALAQELVDDFNDAQNHENSSVSSLKTCVDHSRHIKLPELKISPFDGSHSKWLEFKDTYVSLIHNDETIENVNKLHYLKSFLEGSAKAVINSLTVSSSNYTIAWSLLCERYDNKRLLVNEHIKCLFSIKALSEESDQGLRSLIDTISKNLSALQLLGEPTDKWDTLIIYMASAKLDQVTARKWEEFRSSRESPTLDDFFGFLRKRAIVLETVHAGKSTSSNKHEKRHSLPKTKSFVASSSNEPSSSRCLSCNQEHKLYECPKFKSLSFDDKKAKIVEWNVCSNCLRTGHVAHQCRMGGCRVCKRKHNTLLHRQNTYPQPQQHSSPQHPSPQPQQTQPPSDPPQVEQVNREGTTTALFTNNPVPNNDIPKSKPGQSPSSDPTGTISMSAVSSTQALLSTALVEVTNNDKRFTLRALLDSGSQSSFITEAAQRRLGCCKKTTQCKSVSGLNNVAIDITEHCNIRVKSRYNSFNLPVKCFILPSITDTLPQTYINVKSLNLPHNIQLADPSFYEPAEIDLLLGADIFWDLLGSTKLKSGPNKPILQESHLGWLVAGPIDNKYCGTDKTFCHFSKEIRQLLSKFWELEEVPATKSNDNDEKYCEKLFNETTIRDENGRFCVQIPLRDSPKVLGDSYHIAQKRLFQMERKMRKNPTLRQEYNQFMQEYESLGHMTEVSTPPQHGYYLPHHAVIREQSTTTKLRAVFDASAETTTGVSFNDIQHVGPVVQDDLFSILLRFRQHKFVVSADVEKMYRQVLVTPQQRHLQMILWRESEDQPIKTFKLNTVTYGTASAPFLSTRCLLQLALDCPDEVISRCIKQDFYVDDFISGCESEAELKRMINGVTQVLHSACLPLRKFHTNSPSVFNENTCSVIPKDLDLSSQSSALGLKWDPAVDTLLFPVTNPLPTKNTKRSILSHSAKLFDPLGLLSICTIIPKIILQKLWQTKLEWDESIPADLEAKWLDFATSIYLLSTMQIPRYVLSSEPDIIELHSFSDASQDAYAACVYLRSIDRSGKITVNLLCAKTKVAPVKLQTIPRLELCGALLSARLTAKVQAGSRLKIANVYYWTDSSIVLGWISSKARDLKTFVSNRVTEIQELTSSGEWRHVPGVQNPADLASRGLEPRQLSKAKLWWEGPPFLLGASSSWPENISKSKVELPETKAYTTITNPAERPCGLVNFERFSKLTTLQRGTAYALRFLHNLRPNNTKLTGTLTSDELQASLNYIVKQHQTECFSEEIKLLKNKKGLPSKSRILALNPFIDDDGILRVGGRIQQSSESYDRKHPILLDSTHYLTKLIFTHAHKKLLHGGPQLLLANVRQTYWPIVGRKLARCTVNNCTLCRTMKAHTVNPLMGTLPTPRVTPNLPFHVTGVDFAGPFHIKDRKGRGCKLIKCYLCLFVCFSTKALHLEVASDLSSDVFILCLKRFITRRGKPKILYCDNGRNFVGANNELVSFLQSCSETMASFAAGEGIDFKFSPAYSPHFGGLWEAGVKSAKYHIYRMLGNTHLTYEELSTLFAQVEAILNSRPLTPLSADPTDLEPLTPGHFLIGRPLTALPVPALLDINETRLTRYLQIEKMRQHFWERWRSEFLSELQQRAKWRTNQDGLQEGDMVILKEPNTPPLKWRMGRINQLHPGPDGIARVASVNTARGIIRRAVSNLCPLPKDDQLSPRTPTVFERGEDVHADTAKPRGEGAGSGGTASALSL